jgi:amidase
MPGQNTIPSVCGPLAPTAGALKLMLKSILSQKSWLHDPAVAELPWREELTLVRPPDEDRLTFGFLMTDGLVYPQPPVQRALETIKNLIREMGHDVIDWHPPSHIKAHEIAVS